MNRRNLILAAMAIVAAAGIFELRQASIARAEADALRKQNASLIAKLEQIERERQTATNRLASFVAGIAKVQSSDELLRLRNEVARLRTLQKEVTVLKGMANQSPAVVEWKPGEATNAGRGTPRDTMQTFLWSAVNTNFTEIQQSLVADEADPATISEIEEYAKNPASFSLGEIEGIRLLSQNMVTPTEVELEIQAQLGRGEGISKVLTVRYIDGQWKLVVFSTRSADGKLTKLDLGTKP